MHARVKKFIHCCLRVKVENRPKSGNGFRLTPLFMKTVWEICTHFSKTLLSDKIRLHGHEGPLVAALKESSGGGKDLFGKKDLCTF